MPSAILTTPDLSAALDTATQNFVTANPKSGVINRKSTVSTPGGNVHASMYLQQPVGGRDNANKEYLYTNLGTTRNVIHMKPFPVVMATGEGPYLTDVDNHRYLDLCGEYSAGMFGHSHPIITQATHKAIDQGVALGAVNQYEGTLAELVCARFPSIEMVRFSNSGTEAVATTLSLVRAYQAKSTFLVFQGGYHGGLAAFSNEKENNMESNGTRTMNAPHHFVIAPYSDIPAMQQAAAAHKDDLAGIMVELLQGSSGCIPADLEFIKACRATADETGAVLIFDEVMTSRMSIGGYQSLVGVYPDMTTLGKYLAGGGQNFGAFGGKAEIMQLLEPGRPGGVYHSGTYNNNVVTMATAITTLQEVWTAKAAQELFEKGEWLRKELNAVSAEKGSLLHVSGLGSLMTVHFTGHEVRNSADVQAGNASLKELFFLDMLRKGFFLARRGMISLMTVQTRDQLQTFVDAVREFLAEREDLVRK